MKFFEFDDVVALVAPRPFVGISGHQDHIFPFQGCAEVIERARSMYGALDAQDMLLAVAGENGHRFYPDIAWPAFEKAVSAYHSWCRS